MQMTDWRFFSRIRREFSETLDGTAIRVFLDAVFKDLNFAPLKEVCFGDKTSFDSGWVCITEPMPRNLY